MQVMLMRLISKAEYLIVPKGTKFTGVGKLALITNIYKSHYLHCIGGKNKTKQTTKTKTKKQKQQQNKKKKKKKKKKKHTHTHKTSLMMQPDTFILL